MEENKKKILYVNSCIREESRTDRLARVLLKRLGDYSEVTLESLDIKSLDRKGLDKRTKLLNEGKLDDETFMLAKQFADADIIVISAPFWDNSFPSVLKTYIENIYIIGLVTSYDEKGMPIGLCKAEKLYYVTTAGGSYEKEYSYEYIKRLATCRFGIKDTELIYAENLDIVGNDPEEILDKAIHEVESLEL